MEARKLILSISILTLILAVPAALADDVIADSAGVSFKSLTPGVLTVAIPDGSSFRQEFKAGGASFSLFDEQGNLRPDGYYRWELRPFASPATGERGAATHFETETISGGFTIKDGRVVDSSLPERGLLKDVVHNDDVIVDGSLCVGFDCVNGESFGFDTLRLKENNLRVKAQDTSNSASFPTRDWQLTFNDTSNGGAEKFSIDDIDGGRTPFTITAGAPSNSLFVSSQGRLGIGTSTPVVNLHVVTGNTPTLRLEQNGSSGFTPQTWDVAGNEANFFIRDATNGSTLPFRIDPGAPTDAIHVKATGFVGMGTSSPAARLDVRGDTQIRGTLTLLASDGSTSIQVQQVSGGLAFGSVGTGSMGSEEVRYPGASDAGGAATLFNNTSGNFLRGTTVLADTGGRVGIGTSSPNAAAMLDVNGAIFQRGGVLHADYVFEPDYELESIEDHAQAMWAEKRLPSISARMTDGNGVEIVEIGAQRRGILEELEKAHIYIERLNDALKAKEARLADALRRLQRLEEAD